MNKLRISYEQLHKINGRANPTLQAFFTIIQALHETNQSEEWMDLNFKQSFNARFTKVKMHDTSNLKIESNIMTNRLTFILICDDNDVP